MHSIDLKDSNKTIGKLRIGSDPTALRVTRRADGVVVLFPFEGSFDFAQDQEQYGFVTNVSVTLVHGDLELGNGTNSTFHWGRGVRTFDVGVALGAATIAAIERIRNGGRLTFKMRVTAQSGLVEYQGDLAIARIPWLQQGEWRLEYDRDRWIDLLRASGWGDGVLCEVPLPSQPTPPWDVVWRAIALAREAVDRGGPSGWKTCISECRTALEEWARIEPLDIGQGLAC